MKSDKIYLLLSHSIEDYDYEDSVKTFKNYKDAKKMFDKTIDSMLDEYKKIGIQMSSDVNSKNGWIIERSDNVFTMYESGRAAENEYTLKIVEQTII